MCASRLLPAKVHRFELHMSVFFCWFVSRSLVVYLLLFLFLFCYALIFTFSSIFLFYSQEAVNRQLIQKNKYWIRETRGKNRVTLQLLQKESERSVMSSNLDHLQSFAEMVEAISLENFFRDISLI